MPRPVQPVHPVVAEVTTRVTERSNASRTAYLSRIAAAAAERELRPARTDLGCSNLAHAVAACGGSDRVAMTGESAVGIGIVTSYNDMLSAHAPYEHYPQAIKETAREIGAVARVAGGVPAMCDGITQGRAGMELIFRSIRPDSRVVSWFAIAPIPIAERLDKVVPRPYHVSDNVHAGSCLKV